jgi:hypothetical protein
VEAYQSYALSLRWHQAVRAQWQAHAKLIVQFVIARLTRNNLAAGVIAVCGVATSPADAVRTGMVGGLVCPVAV